MLSFKRILKEMLLVNKLILFYKVDIYAMKYTVVNSYVNKAITVLIYVHV